MATKFGFVGDEHGQVCVDGRPERAKIACEASLRRLGTEMIDLYYLHRRDESVAIEATAGAMADLVREGKIQHLGFPNSQPKPLARPRPTIPCGPSVGVQSYHRDPESTVLQVCRERGTVLVAFSPLGRGLLTGKVKSRAELAEGEYRRECPVLQKEMARNALVEALESWACPETLSTATKLPWKTVALTLSPIKAGATEHKEPSRRNDRSGC